MKFQSGDKILIGKEKFDVIKVTGEVDRWDSKRDKLIGEHTAIELHKMGDSSLHPTHLIKIYKDNKRIFLFKIVQEKLPIGVEKPRQRGIVFSYINKKEILSKEIKIESTKEK